MRTEHYNYSATKLKMVRDLVDEYEANTIQLAHEIKQ